MTTPTQPNDEKKPIVQPEIGVTKIDFSKVARPIAEVLEELAPQGERVKASEIVDQEITLHSIRFFSGQFGPAAFVIFTDSNGELCNMVMSQKIILPKLAAVANSLPVSCKIVLVERAGAPDYYDIE